jgi:dihydrofolate reductase
LAIKISVALDKDGGFTKDKKIPWNIPEDFKHFMKLTKGAICVCGRNTYEEMLDMKKKRLGSKYKSDSPLLSKRQTYVVSSTLESVDGAELVDNLIPTLKRLLTTESKDIYILGGEQLFIEALPYVSEATITVIPISFDCDQFFPTAILQDQFEMVSGTNVDTIDNGTIMVVKYVRVTK